MKYFFAVTYGSGIYGTEGTYGDVAAQQTTTVDSGTGNSGLVNTGMAVNFITFLAVAIVLVSLVIRLWRRPKEANRP